MCDYVIQVYNNIIEIIYVNLLITHYEQWSGQFCSK